MHKILIVEDEPDTSRVVAKRLEKAGFEVVVAVDAYQGISLAHKEGPDLIILDLMLPAGGGLAVLKNLEMSSKVTRIPVVVLTGIKDEEYKDAMLKRGIEAYLEKPYDADELIATIRNILQKEG